MMIDEAVLTAVLREATDAIEIPEGGAERVLALRDRSTNIRSINLPSRRRVGTRNGESLTGGIGRKGAIAVALAAVVLLFVVVGLAGGHKSDSHSAASSATTFVSGAGGGSQSTTSAPTSTGSASGAAGAGSPSNSSSSGGSASGGTSSGVAGPASGVTPSTVAGPATTVPSASGVAPLPTQVIKTGSLAVTVKTGTVGNAVDSLTTIAAGLGGYVQNSQSTTVGSSPTATVILRVPVANFDQLVTQAETLGKVTSVTTSGQDVTAQSVDLAAQIQALQASRDQFLQILTKAQTIGDILSVEQQISGLQTQISQLQGQLKVLNDQTSYSTLTVTVSQPAPTVVVPPPPHRPSGLSAAWAHARRSFTHGLESVVASSGGLAVFLLCAGAVGLIGWLGWRMVRRRLV